ESGVADLALAERDIDVLEPRRAHRVGRAVGTWLHGLAQDEHHVAPRALQGGEVLGRRLPTRHDPGKLLARVREACDSVEQLAHDTEMRLALGSNIPYDQR